MYTLSLVSPAVLEKDMSPRMSRSESSSCIIGYDWPLYWEQYDPIHSFHEYQ